MQQPLPITACIAGGTCTRAPPPVTVNTRTHTTVDADAGVSTAYNYAMPLPIASHRIASPCMHRRVPDLPLVANPMYALPGPGPAPPAPPAPTPPRPAPPHPVDADAGVTTAYNYAMPHGATTEVPGEVRAAWGGWAGLDGITLLVEHKVGNQY